MTAFYRRKKRIVCGVLITIESGAVTASIVLSPQSAALPELLYSTREAMPMTHTKTTAQRDRTMRRALFSALLTLEQRGIIALHARIPRARIQKILVSCGAPWSQTATQFIHFSQEKSFTVSERLIAEILAHARETEKNELGEEHSHAEHGQRIVEQSVIDIALNGYSARNPYGKSAREVTVAHLRGLVPDAVPHALEDASQYLWSDVGIRIHTSPLILYCVLRDLYPDIHSALIVDISDEATELSLVRHDILYESATFAFGEQTLLRAIAKLAGTIPEEARAYFIAETRRRLTPAQETIFTTARQDYGEQLTTALADLATRNVLPRTVFLVSPDLTAQFFSGSITAALADTGTSHIKRTVIPLSTRGEGAGAVLPENIQVHPRIALLARFFHTLHACGEIDNYR